MKANQRFLAMLLAFAPMVAVAGSGSQLPDFVFQGRLEQAGVLANGNFDLEFRLWDDLVDGSQVGDSIIETGFPVVNGVFSINLAFPGAFSGNQLYLETVVEGVVLPRQPIATAPVAQWALDGNWKPQGPLSVVSIASASGMGDFNSGGVGALLEFIGPHVEVVVAEGHQLSMSANKALGTSHPEGASNLFLGACFKRLAPILGPVTFQGGNMAGLQIAPFSRQIFSVNHIFTGLSAGTYRIGMCGLTPSTKPPRWNSHSIGYITVMVFQP